jgi:chitodextrinase
MEPKQNVNVVYARPFWRDVSESPRQEGLHWNRNGETYYRIGAALGDAMVAIHNNPETDGTPPSPNPMTFASAPAWVDSQTVTMTANTATDTNGVMYYFTCTSGGGHDSGWQQSPVYTDTGLTPGVTYTYTVTARDRSSSQNATAPSAGASATTPAVDTTPPTPNAMTFAVAPAAVSPFGIKMVTTTASDDLYGVEYYFTETSGNPGGSDSGWQSSPIYFDGGLQPGTEYTYTVTARDTSLAQVQGTASSPISATTPASPGSSMTAGGTIWKVMDESESQTYEGIGTKYFVSVHNDILRFASAPHGVNVPVDVTVVGTVSDYRFHGQTGGVVGTVADGPANLISSLSTTSDGTVTNRHNANFWTDTDPLDEWSTEPAGKNGMAKIANGTAIVNVAGLRAGSIYLFYGGTGEAVSFSATMQDGQAVQPDISLGSFGALPSQSGTRWHVCSVDFVNDAGYDTITWTLNASNGRFFGSVLVETPGVLGGSDTDPPLPGTMSFLTGPEAVSDTSITMTSATARDNSGTEYYFACTSGGGNDSGWQYSPTYTDTGLTPGTEYTYTVQARDRSAGQNANIASAPASVFTEVTDLLAPPASSFATGPKALSESIITMTAASVMDPHGVQYFFDETSGNPSGTDSAWQDSPIYTDTGLSPNTTYSYTVTTRDKLLNTGSPSASAPATTDPADGTPPATPGFESAPTAVSSTVVSMTAFYVSDPNGVEYYFTCTSGGGQDSGWQSSRVYIDSGLTPETSYTYTVTARDKSIGQNQSGASAPLSATTPAAVVYTMTIQDVGATAPATDIFLSSPANGSNTKVENITGSDLDRGQTFITPDTGDANTQWGLTAITLQLNDKTLSSGAPVMNLRIVNWGPDTQLGAPGTVIFNESGQFPSGLGNNDYFTFELGETVMLNENGNYAFLLSFDSFGDTIKPKVGATINSTYADGAVWGGGTLMTPNQDFTFYLKGTAFGGGGGGNPPPTPGFASGPVASSPTAVSMTATTVADPEGSAVEYYFTCTAGGGNDSGWQSGTSYTDTGLTPDTLYSYTVKARDASGNESAPSAASSATTSADSNPPPTPGFASGPTAVSSSAVTMTATSVTDPEGSVVEYYFTCTAGGGNDSGWQSGTSYTNTGLSPNTQYSYTVKAKDAAGNPSAPSAAASATTQAGGSSQLTITDSGATAPTSNIFESYEPGTQTVTRISADELTDRDRGQSFTVGQIGAALDGEQYGLTAITLKLNSLTAGTTGNVTLTIVSWDGLVNNGGATKTQLYQQTGSFSASALDAGDYFTMNLGTTINLTEGANYAFLLSADSGSGLDFRPAVGQNTNATHEGVIWSGGTTVTTNQDLVFYLQGTVIGGGGGYSDWATSNVGGQTADGDFNGDGVDNGIAYFMDDTGVITLPGIAGGTITWTNGGNIPHTEYGTRFKVQTSHNLATWTDVLSGDGNLANTAGSVSYTLPTGLGKWFTRLVVAPD